MTKPTHTGFRDRTATPKDDAAGVIHAAAEAQGALPTAGGMVEVEVRCRAACSADRG